MGTLANSIRTQPAALLGALPVFIILAIPPLFLNSYGTQVLMIALYYVALGVSWNILAGYTGQFSLAHHAFATIGAYTSAAVVLGSSAPHWMIPPSESATSHCPCAFCDRRAMRCHNQGCWDKF